MADRSVSVILKAVTAPYVAGLGKAQAATAGFARSSQAQLAGTNTKMNQLGASTGAMPGRFAALGAAAGVAGLAVAGGITFAVKQFAAFDVAMDAVGASTGATEAELEQLGKTALSAAADTKFGATDAAYGIEALGKAGVETADIVGGGLKGALDLAAAGEIEVAEAAEIAAGALTQFKLSGSDVPHVADLMAAAAGKAQGSVDDMGMAFKQSGLVASQMGLSLEETTGTLAAFASNALIGSDAGTSFRTMLLRLANPSGEAADLMERLGIAAYDAQGNFVGMESLAGQLKSQLGGLSQAERDAALATIFGSDAIRAANVLYQQGAEGVAEWTAKVDDAGYASEQAAKRTDNLRGDLERLGGTLEQVAIENGGAFNDFLRGAVQELDHMVEGTSRALNEEAEIWRQNAAVWDFVATPSIKNAEAAFGEFTNRIAAAHDPLRAAEADTARLAGQAELYAGRADIATTSTSLLAEQMGELQTAAFETANQFLGTRDAVRGWEQALDDAAVALDENGAVLDISTQKGRDNQAALDGMAAAALRVLEDMVAAGQNTDTAQRQMRTALIATGVRFGMTEAQAADYADQVLAIPATRVTTPVFADTVAARKVREFKALLAGIDETVGVRVNVSTGGLGGLGGLQSAYGVPSGNRIFPLPGGPGAYRVTQGPHPINAIDYGASTGTPVMASFTGQATMGDLGNRSYGKNVFMTGAGQRWLRVAHMSRFARNSGPVTKGQLLGWTGNTGNSTGPHAHIENFHTGGWSTGGMINTLRGEYVVNPAASAAWGGVLEAINSGRGGSGNGSHGTAGISERMLQRAVNRGINGATLIIDDRGRGRLVAHEADLYARAG